MVSHDLDIVFWFYYAWGRGDLESSFTSLIQYKIFQLEMEQDDVIEVYQEQTGGSRNS